MSSDNNKKSKKIEKSSSISYTGSVTVKYVSKNGKSRVVKKHNNGKLGLFKFILYSLASKSSQSTFFPISVMCYSDTTSYGAEHKCLTATQPYKAEPYVDVLSNPNKPKITYCFDIPNNNIIKGNSIIRLVLVNQKYNSNATTNTEDSICAEIILDSSQSIQTDTNENIVIYWTLSFSNNETDSSSVISD